MGRKRRLPAEPFCIRIESLAESGRGIARHEGRGLEVYDALPGEAVMARYLFGRRFRGQAQALDVIERAPERIEPECPSFGTCSACSLQHLEPSSQIAFKQSWLQGQFDEHQLAPEQWLEPLQAELWHYRRKARLSVRKVEAKGRVLVGFRERDSRFVTDMQTCHVLPEAVAVRIPDLCALIDSMDGAGHIPQIEVTCGDDSCALILRHLEPLSAPDLARLADFSRAHGLEMLTQGGGPESVRALGDEAVVLEYRLPEYGLTYRFSPQDFVQVNAGLNRLMIEQALRLLALKTSDRVLELFCGLGNFSLPMARHCAEVVACEGDAALVDRARSNAHQNGVGNVRFEQADLYDDDGDRFISGSTFDKVLLDPPRSGAAPVLASISDSGAGRVVYVSCNPATLAEDASKLVRQYGYTLASAGVMDMFPHTTHVESMALFTRE